METKYEPSDDHEPCSDTGSSEKKSFEENAAKDTPVTSSSSPSVLEAGTNQDSIKGKDAEANDDADAEKNRIANTDILADTEANPKILEAEGKKMILFLVSQEITPLALNSTALRHIGSSSESIGIKNQEPESLKGRKQEAIKLGVGLSNLVAEAMFLATDELLDKTDEELRKLMISANGALDVKGIVVYNLTAIFDGLKKSMKEQLIRPRIEEEPEKLSATDREIEDCKRELRKIDMAITEVKKLHFNSLSSDEPRSYTIRTPDLEEAFLKLWETLFQTGRKRKASYFDSFCPYSSDSEDSVSQPSIH